MAPTDRNWTRFSTWIINEGISSPEGSRASEVAKKTVIAERVASSTVPDTRRFTSLRMNLALFHRHHRQIDFDFAGALSMKLEQKKRHRHQRRLLAKMVKHRK